MTTPPPAVQGIALPNSKEPGYSPIYRNAKFPDVLQPYETSEVTTLYESFERSVRQNGKNDCLGHREYDRVTGIWGPFIWETYEQIQARRNAFGSGLAGLFDQITASSGSNWDGPRCVTIYSLNRPEWVITDLACHAHSLTVVALYDTLGEEASEFILNQTQSPIVVASIDHVPHLIQMKDKIPYVKIIISMDNLSEGDLKGRSKGDLLGVWAKEKGVKLFSFSDVEAFGTATPRQHIPPTPETVTTINYTSGTTGMPKGAILTHSIAVAALVGPKLMGALDATPGDTIMSFLPLAHIYERENVNMTLYSGMRMGFFHGDVMGLLDDIQKLQPTIITLVPRVLEKIASAIQSATIEAPGVRGKLSRAALAAKYARMTGPAKTFHHPLWDRIWSRKIRQVLGGKIRLIVSGSAPASRDTLKFLRAALACDVIEGYGLTETFASALLCLPGDFDPGHCGPLVPTVEARLKDVADMGYTANDLPNPRGELLVRGYTVFKGYYKDESKTADAFDGDWFRTGDICEIDSVGRIYIIDRVKNFFKLAQGEYISPERLENIYISHPAIATILVHGDSNQTCLIAIIGVDPEPFAVWATKIIRRPVSVTDIATVFNDPIVTKAMIKELDRIANHKKLQGFEKIKGVYLASEPFSLENGLLTPTLKLKRPESTKAFRDEIDGLYRQVNETKSKVQAKL